MNMPAYIPAIRKRAALFVLKTGKRKIKRIQRKILRKVEPIGVAQAQAEAAKRINAEMLLTGKKTQEKYDERKKLINDFEEKKIIKPLARLSALEAKKEKIKIKYKRLARIIAGKKARKEVIKQIQITE